MEDMPSFYRPFSNWFLDIVIYIWFEPREGISGKEPSYYGYFVYGVGNIVEGEVCFKLCNESPKVPRASRVGYRFLIAVLKILFYRLLLYPSLVALCLIPVTIRLKLYDLFG